MIVKRPKPETPEPMPTPIATPTITPTTPPNSDENADWKTYKNDEYFFEINYPPNWNVSTGTVYKGIEVKFRNQDTLITIQAGSRYNPKSGGNYPLEEWTDSYRSALIRNKVDFTEEKIIFGGKEATEFSYKVLTHKPSVFYREVFAVNSASIYKIIVNFATNEPAIDKILSTFRFIE